MQALNKLLVSLNTRELPRTGDITKGFDYTEFKTYENVSKSFLKAFRVFPKFRLT